MGGRFFSTLGMGEGPHSSCWSDGLMEDLAALGLLCLPRGDKINAVTFSRSPSDYK